ncbi:MAG: tripartite tricarboxylate transporter substrate binding protein [Betaproteobacteria bacterium]|nr:tripartite tricarboxylate transporter substrate binding protein [Betaproteobacteria bacterium]
MAWLVRWLSIVAAVASSCAAAQDYPNKPLRFVVPFPPGGSADILARTVGDKLTAALGQPVIVENKPGAGGIVGAETVAKSPPDGHTLLFANTNIAINPSLYKSLPYDTAKAFAPVILMVTVPNLLLVAEDVPAKSVAELIALAKASPGKLNYASAGNGTFPHLAVELFKLQAGISLTHVPYKGAAPALNALLGKEVQVLSNDLLNALSHVKAGKVKALAITGTSRSSAIPEIPSMAEAGLKDYAAVGWQGVMVPAGTPAAVIARLNAEIDKALKDHALRDRLTAQGLEVVGGSVQQFAEFVRRDTERWRGAVAASGAKID